MCAFTDKLSQSRERELRRALFSLKQMFQVDKLTFRCLSAGKCRKQFDVFVIFLFHYFVLSQFSSHCNCVILFRVSEYSYVNYFLKIVIICICLSGRLTSLAVISVLRQNSQYRHHFMAIMQDKLL